MVGRPVYGYGWCLARPVSALSWVGGVPSMIVKDAVAQWLLVVTISTSPSWASCLAIISAVAFKGSPWPAGALAVAAGQWLGLASPLSQVKGALRLSMNTLGEG